MPQAPTAKALIAVLRSDAATFDKARACQQLAALGDKEAVPALAALLADEKLASLRPLRPGIDRRPSAGRCPARSAGPASTGSSWPEW